MVLATVVVKSAMVVMLKTAVTYSVCSLVVPTLEEAILTSVLKKNFK